MVVVVEALEKIAIGLVLPRWRKRCHAQSRSVADGSQIVAVTHGKDREAQREKESTVTDRAARLIELAREKFGHVTKAQEKELARADEVLFRAVGDAETADYGAEDDRVLAADRVAWLCIDPQASSLVTHRGIGIRGAQIDGSLDLHFAKIPFPLRFEASSILGKIDLRNAEVRALALPGTHAGPIEADGLKVDGPACFCNGFEATGEVRLLGARIAGSLDCDGGEFRNPTGNAIDADELEVGGSVKFGNGFKATGEVRLLGATIGGSLRCAGGQFINERARILIQTGAEARQGDRLNALSLNRVKVEGSVFLHEGFTAVGEVRLVNATVGGYFHWRRVSSSASLTLDLRSTRIGTLWDDAKSWPNRGRDDPECWRHRGKLLLHGLVYTDIDERAPMAARDRLEWLRRQPRDQFRPQPYEQLATVLRRSGHTEEATAVLIAKEKDRGRLSNLTWSAWWWNRVFGRLIGYGYRPGRAFWIGLCMMLFPGWWVFGMAWHEDMRQSIIVPTKEGTHLARGSVSEIRSGGVVPDFNALMYSVDVFVPVIDLRQAEYWLPTASRGRELIDLPWFTLRTGGLLRAYLWFHILAGWTLSTLWVVGLTGLVRRG